MSDSKTKAQSLQMQIDQMQERVNLLFRIVGIQGEIQEDSIAVVKELVTKMRCDSVAGKNVGVLH